MVLKMYQIKDFPVVFEKIKNQKLSFKTSYQLTLMAKQIQIHLDYFQEQFRNLILKYGLKNENGELIFTEDGQGVKLIEETRNQANTDLEELHMLDVEVPDSKFSPDDFGDVELTPMEMTIIMPFIAE